MPTLVPLPPGIAYGLPWRMNFRTGRPPATLEKFADPAFVNTLTPEELKHCEAVFSTLLEKMLKTGRLNRHLGRLPVNRHTSEKLLDQRSTGGIRISLGRMRFTLSESIGLIGDSVNKLLKALAPDPDARPQTFRVMFSESEWEDIGHHGASPKATGPKKARKPRARSTAPAIFLKPPTRAAWRRRKQNPGLRLMTDSGDQILGNDYRLAWLLYEIHKVVPLDRPEPVLAKDVVQRLLASKVPDAPALGSMLESSLIELERAQVTHEVRGVLSSVIANATKPEPWTERNLFWTFGVPGDQETFAPSFWSCRPEVQRKSRRLLSKLRPLTDPLLTNSLYSPALDILRVALDGFHFIGARRLQAKLGPVLHGAEIIGVAKFLTEVLHRVDRMGGRLITVAISTSEGNVDDLFYWTHDIQALDVHAVCAHARELTLARGAFSIAEIVQACASLANGALTEAICTEILSEWPAVRWLEQHGWGVVDGVSALPELVEHMLNAAWPHALSIDDVLESIQSSMPNLKQVVIAQQRLGSQELVATDILIAALDGVGNIHRLGQRKLGLKHKPKMAYWDWHPVELDVVEYLNSVGGTALNRDIYKRFKGDKSVDQEALADALRVLPFLYAPSPLKTAVRPWVIPRKNP